MNAPEAQPVHVEVSPRTTAEGVIDGIPDDGATSANDPRSAAGARAADSAPQQVAQQAAQAQSAQVAVDASTTTDPHRDQGSSATGHVEDATPDPRGAGPAEEPEPTPEPEPEPEPTPPPPPPVEATPEATTAHDDDAT